MLYPSLTSLLKQVNSRYLLVNIIARRAREISGYSTAHDNYPGDKPVSRAINEIAAGELHVTITEDED